MVKSDQIEHPVIPTVKVWGAYTTGDPSVKKAQSSFSNSRKWSIVFGVVAGVTLTAYVCTCIFVAPNLSTHTWTVIGVGAILPGIGFILFAINASKAVKHYKEIESEMQGLKKYSLLQLVFGNLFYDDSLSETERENYVLGIRGKDVPTFLKYIDEHLLKKTLQTVSEETADKLQKRLSDLIDYIKDRDDWEEQLKNASLNAGFFEQLKNYQLPIEDSTKEN